MFQYQYRGGRVETIHLKITYSVLAELYDRDVRTIKRWVKQGRLDPSNLLDIIEKFNHRHLLDGRRSTSCTT